MVTIEKASELERANDLLYNEAYYQNYNGEDYGRNDRWLDFFGNIADNIVDTIKPKSVLDIGCAYGLLVESLRDRGCQAYGIDVSDYALSRARNDIKPYLAIETILKPLERRYDLIVSIEVIEHIKEEDCSIVIKNMCDAADNILISTTPDDFDDPTHFNVNPPAYWIKKFAEFGFIPDIMHDAGYLTPYSLLFIKADNTLSTEVENLFGEKKLQDYYLSKIRHERNILKSKVPIFESKIQQLQKKRIKQEQVISDGISHIKNLEKIILTERSAREHIQNLFDERSASFSWKVTKPLRFFGKLIDIVSPFKPKMLASSSDKGVFHPKIDNNVKWVTIKISSYKIEQCEVSLIAKMDEQYIRLQLLKTSMSNNQVSLLARLNPGWSDIAINTLRGDINDVSICQISSAQAWLSIMIDRWRKGRGAKAAIGLLSRTIRIAAKQGMGAALASIWPAYSKEMSFYDEWLTFYDGPNQHKNIAKFLSRVQWQPCISIVMPTYNSNINYLSRAIASVRNQSYQNWQLCIADDASEDEKLLNFLRKLEKEEGVDLIFREKNEHIAAATNSALSLAKGEFITFLDHDDELHIHALATVVAYLNENQDLDLLYSDEDKIDQYNNRSDPFFKPDWSPDLLLSQNYICHLAIYRRDFLKRLHGMRVGTEGAQDYDLALRAAESTNKIQHIPHVLYHWRAVPGSTALQANEKNYAHERAENSIEQALRRRNIDGAVMETGLGVYHRIRYALPSAHPFVSIIIPTRDRIDLLAVCIDGLLNKTNYQNFEIIVVDNNSQKKETLNYLEEIQQAENIRVLSFPGEFNYSAINNFAVARSSGEVVVFLNNDIEIIQDDWLRELVSHAIRPGVGAVGCRLYYPDDHVQHDGIIIGIGGVAGYAHPHMERYDSGEFGRSRIIRNYSAVTAAALAVKKSIFNEVAGLDEKNLAVAFNDVDFCLRVMEAGYRNLYTPFAELYHHESVSRGPDTDPKKAARFEKEALYMKKRWGPIIQDDPFYNPNLSLTGGYKIDLGRGKPWPWSTLL